MRILANYGYKANGDMYSVTFETMGDVPAAQASQTVDELFRLAKEAVQRQLAGAGTNVSPQPATTVTIPSPVYPPQADHRPDGPKTGDGTIPQPVPPTPTASVVVSPSAAQNGNGLSAVPSTAQAGKRPQIKDPTLPATSKQIGLLKRLAREKGRRFEDLTDLTMGEASEHIDELMAA